MTLTQWMGIKAVSLLLLCAPHSVQTRAWDQNDIYIIIYATYNAKTGHAGIAIDRYSIKVKDCANCKGRTTLDTLATGELSYFDLWPAHDDFQKSKMYENDLALYHHLPGSSSEPPLTVWGFSHKGIGQINLGPCDAILKIPSTAFQDFKLMRFLNKIVDQQTPFNLWEYNCADFVEKAVEFTLETDIDADEMILFDRATTPNCLYKALRKIPGVTVLKDPGSLVNGSFFQERILKRPQP